MKKPTLSTDFDLEPLSIEWAARTFDHQPEQFSQAYQNAAQVVADTLSHPVYTVTVLIPYYTDQRTHPAFIVLRAGNVFHRLVKKLCHPVLIQKLHELSNDRRSAMREGAVLVCYLAAQQLLSELPDAAALRDHYTGFDKQGMLTTAGFEQAAVMVEHLAHFVYQLRLIEQLFPGWVTQDRYSNAHSLLTGHLIEQGRALANFHTQQIVHNILSTWKAGEITRGLTIFLPYLDERRCTMVDYKIVVIPTGRILFRPEFVIGACRVSERQVRKDPNLSPATRWQLLSQLDLIIQAFEAEIHPIQ